MATFPYKQKRSCSSEITVLQRKMHLILFLPCNILLNAVEAALGIVFAHIGQVEGKPSQIIWIF